MHESLIDKDWRERLKPFERLVVGFSGGLDSTVLLHALHAESEFKSRLQAVHIQHGLSPHSAMWQAHCERFCTELGIPIAVKTVSFATQANLEALARAARHRVFSKWMTHSSCLLFAHHQDDQAETVLLQLCRGTGVLGLAGIRDFIPFNSGYLARPLLSTTRQQLTAYARQHTLSWIEDESNQDTRFSRNLMRLKVLPLLKTRWPSVVKQLLQVAEHCHDAQQNLDALARLDYPELDVTGDCLDTASLADLSDSRINNVLRAWLTHRGIKSPSSKTFARFIPEVMRAASDKTPCVAWDGIEVRRYQTALYILREPHVFKPPLLQINLDATGVYIPPSSRVEVRFREGGEQLVWRGKTRRLKDLMNQWRILPWMRDKIPLMYIDGQLAVVVGWCIADTHYREEGEFLYHITQQAYGSDYNAA